MRILIVVAVGIVVAGCQTTAIDPDPEIFGRADCKRAASHPEIVKQYELDSEVCKYRAMAGAQAGITPIRDASIAGSLERAITGNNIGKSIALSCMAEKGYFYRRKSEHDNRCKSQGSNIPPVQSGARR